MPSAALAPRATLKKDAAPELRGYPCRRGMEQSGEGKRCVGWTGPEQALGMTKRGCYSWLDPALSVRLAYEGETERDSTANS